MVRLGQSSSWCYYCIIVLYDISDFTTRFEYYGRLYMVVQEWVGRSCYAGASDRKEGLIAAPYGSALPSVFCFGREKPRLPEECDCSVLLGKIIAYTDRYLVD